MTFLSRPAGLHLPQRSVGYGSDLSGNTQLVGMLRCGLPFPYIYAFSLNAFTQCLPLGPVSPPQPPGAFSYRRKGPKSAVVSMELFPGCFCTSAGPRARSGFVSSMMVVVIVNTLFPSLIRNLHATVHRLCINDHGGVVLVHGGRQLTLRLGETLADGEHAVDDDSVYALFYLALRFEFD